MFFPCRHPWRFPPPKLGNSVMADRFRDPPSPKRPGQLPLTGELGKPERG